LVLLVTDDGASSPTNMLAARLGVALGSAYEVLRPLGQGGFAVVFLVRDRSLKRDLAVKVLSPDLITSKTTLDRFQREAETIAQLAHPNIVPLHFIGQENDLLYLAMQCVSGGSIADRLEREGALPVADVVRIVTEVASALAHAHKRGVIHRDIKPPNVLVDAESGRCLVTDFGIARSTGAANLTATGVMLGTPAYLSPEQVTGEPLDQRVDIYALGVMAYELLAGCVPFTAPTPTAAMMKRLGGPPDSVTMVRPDVPAHIARAITACLAPDPAERLQTADDVIRAFGGEPVFAAVLAPRAGNPVRARVALGTVLALVALGAAAYGVSRRSIGPSASVVAPADSDMVVIPAGDYPIGDDAGPSNARPRHVVRLSQFRIGRTEESVGDYANFVKATGAPSPWSASGAAPDPRLPVTRVPFSDAENFCAWKYRNGGRLPTEIEWEAAARGAEGHPYPSGTVQDAGAANTATAHRNAAAPVGSFPRSATRNGLQDMSGNVWEWTSSALTGYPGGEPMADSLKAYRVIRGGAFDSSDSVATGWWRGYARSNAGAASLPNTGFRCARQLTVDVPIQSTRFPHRR
jgi:formylglycine-generating enzyme required for sulfatase activity/tRNA A-37 threonylcarbamoyl transferase component Bud32